MECKLRTLWMLLITAGIALAGCGDDTRVSGISGTEDTQTDGLAKRAVFTESPGQTDAISLEIEGGAQIHPRGPRIKVMTRNVYLGADINRILVPDDPSVPIPVLVAQTWGMVQQTNFSERARALADEIAAATPHLVGLQEVSLYRMQNPGDVLLGNPTAAEDVVLDFLAILPYCLIPPQKGQKKRPRR